MLTDTEIKKKGLKVLVENLGDIDAEKFIRLITKEPFDYTQWQSTLWQDETVEQVSEKAMRYRAKRKE
ncbi:MAG TPA: hypothetical protein ENN90_08470 [Mariniphaga anaerophila]|uniref:Uncharacterized protein n=1 Tax=Mariniphaga anaerophila TaxID=1484053 RepID=A0A831PLU8_9BACT|nr:hypothetical protein [Mariniphaga anaerophila]